MVMNTKEKIWGTKTKIEVGGNDSVREGRRVNSASPLASRITAAVIAGITAFLPIKESQADHHQVSLPSENVENGSIYSVGDKELYVPAGRELKGFTDMVDSSGIHCAVTNEGTFCSDQTGAFQVDDFPTGEIHYLTSGGDSAELWSSNSGGNVEFTGGDRYELFDYTRLGDQNGLDFSFGVRPLTDSSLLMVKDNVDQGAVGSEYSLYIVPVTYNSAFDYDRSRVLRVVFDNLGLDVHRITRVMPQIVNNKIFSVFNTNITGEKVIVSVSINAWDIDARNIQVTDVATYYIGQMQGMTEVFHDDGQSVFFMGRNDVGQPFVPYRYDYNVQVADADNDGIEDAEDNCLNIANNNQLDGDNDGVGDACDNCPETANADQNPDACGVVVIEDTDGDGIEDDRDNCPANRNADQADLDNDGLGDACDPDRDGDGISNQDDNCPDEHDGRPEGTGIGQGELSDGCPIEDADGDGIEDGRDNCPETENADQGDSDFDGLGDVCDPTPCPEGMIFTSARFEEEEGNSAETCINVEEPDAGSDTDTDTDTGGNDTGNNPTPDTGGTPTEDTGVEPDVPGQDTGAPSRPDVMVPGNGLGDGLGSQPEGPSCSAVDFNGKGSSEYPTGVMLAIVAAVGVAMRRRKKDLMEK